jgi:hypothetical protein
MKDPFSLIKAGVFVLALAAFLFLAKANAQIRVNVGGPAVTQPAGVVWAADTFNLGQPEGGATVSTVKGTDSPQVFKTARWYETTATYALTVEEGKTYTVRLHSADTWPNTQRVGARVWSASVNGQVRGPIDVFARVGANAAHVEQWTNIKPVAGKVSIVLSKGAADNPLMSAIEILPETAATTDLKVQWDHSITNTDGTPLVGRTGYRIELSSSEAGPWVTAATVATNSSTLKVGYGKNCTRVLTLTATETSEPSASVCVTKAPPPSVPKAPVNVGAQFTGSTLATGPITGSFAGSQPTWPLSHGSKVGKLLASGYSG